MKIRSNMIPRSASNRPGTRLNATEIAVHETANTSVGAGADNQSRYVKGADARRRQVSWHWTVDDKEAVQSLPENEVGWHAGSGNNRAIGVEICVNSDGDFAQAKRNAQALIARIQDRRGIGKSSVKSHRHYTGKNCPANILRTGFQSFVNGVGGSGGSSGGSGSGAPTYNGQTFAQAHEDVWMQDGYEWLQEGLNDVMNAGLTVDGTFGQKSLNATRDFHDQYGISSRGNANYGRPGPATKEKLEELQSGGSSGANLTVDGRWGAKTTEALQNALGTFADGVISSQPRNSVTNAIAGGIEFGSNGSPVIEALQRKVGASVDGKLGPDTVRNLQSYLGTPVDGVISNPSAMVEELQRRLNAGTF